jgi:hypothetical protein
MRTYADSRDASTRVCVRVRGSAEGRAKVLTLLALLLLLYCCFTAALLALLALLVQKYKN